MSFIQASVLFCAVRSFVRDGRHQIHSSFTNLSPTNGQAGSIGLGTERQYICCTDQNALNMEECIIFWSQLPISKKVTVSMRATDHLAYV